MGISRRALTVLGLTGITATGGGYWHLRTPKTVLEAGDPEGVEQYSFSLDYKSFIEWRNDPAWFVIYDTDTLDIKIAEGPSVNLGSSNVLPAGNYKVSAYNNLPEIRAAPVYYFRDAHEFSVSIDTILDENAENRQYLISNLLEEFREEPVNDDIDRINRPTEPINTRASVRLSNELELTRRLTKRMLDPIVETADQQTLQQYQQVWKEFERYMSAYKTDAQLNHQLTRSDIESKLINKLTNVPTLDYIEYDITLPDIEPTVLFYTKKASIRNDQATVPTGLEIHLDSDIPSVEKDTNIYTNTFPVPASLTPRRSPPDFDNRDIGIFNTEYRQWQVDYADIGYSILRVIEDSIDSL